MADDWRDLKVGDRVRIVRLPSGADSPGYTFPLETRLVYRQLIARGRAVRVYRVDDNGLPWIRCRFKRKRGGWEHHFLALNDDSWVRVKSRS
jgi:hypothetical protein